MSHLLYIVRHHSRLIYGSTIVLVYFKVRIVSTASSAILIAIFFQYCSKYCNFFCLKYRMWYPVPLKLWPYGTIQMCLYIIIIITVIISASLSISIASGALMLRNIRLDHVSVGWSVGPQSVLWHNGWLDPDAVWDGEWGQMRGGCIRWGWLSSKGGQFWGWIRGIPL